MIDPAHNIGLLMALRQAANAVLLGGFIVMIAGELLRSARK